MNNQKRGFGCLPIIGAIVLATVGGGYLYLKGKLPGQEFTAYQAGAVIPSETLAIAHVSTKQELWSDLTTMGTPEAQAISKKALTSIDEDLEAQQINFKSDIQPWIEGISFALVPTTNAEPEVLVIMGIKDKIKAWEYQRKFTNKFSENIQKSQYKNLNIFQVTTEEGEISYYTVVGNYIVISQNQETIQAAIDTHKGDSSYQDQPGVKKVLSKLTLKSPLVQIYSDDVDSLINSRGSLSTESSNSLNTINNFIAGVGVTDQGLHFQAMVEIKSNNMLEKPTNATREILDSLPGETWLFVSGADLNKSWQNFLVQADSIVELKPVVDNIRRSSSEASLDVDTEVFGWMDKDYAIALVSTEQGLNNFGIGGVILMQTTDSQTAKNSLTKLDQYLQNSGLIIVKNTTIGKTPVIEWQNNYQQNVASYGWLNNRTLAMTIGMPWQTIDNVDRSNSVTNNSAYKKMVKALPSKNLGYFYLDMPQLRQQLNKFASMYGGGIPYEANAILESIEGIGGVNIMNDTTEARSDLIIFLQQNE